MQNLADCGLYYQRISGGISHWKADKEQEISLGFSDGAYVFCDFIYRIADFTQGTGGRWNAYGYYSGALYSIGDGGWNDQLK